MYPSKIPSSVSMFIFRMLAFSSFEMMVVMSFVIPILSIPFMESLARKDRYLCVFHCALTIYFPWFDISLMALGHFALCTIILLLLGCLYPITSSPGIGLQHSAIS